MTTNQQSHQGGATSINLTRALVVLMAVATGLSVASNYYAQPLLPAIGSSLRLSSGVASLIVTVAQIGYGVGLVLIVPLGDLLRRRNVIVALALLTGCSLIWFGAANSSAELLPAAFAVGAFSVLAQIIVPLAASLADDADRGRIVGMVMSGLLVGILLARTFSGLIAGATSWRVVYLVAAGMMAVLAMALRLWLPNTEPVATLSYPRLVGSAWSLLAAEPVLRLRAIYGALSFGTFSIFWTSMSFLLARHYQLSSTTIGFFGLAGAAGAGVATLAGKRSDQERSVSSTGIAAAFIAGSWLILWVGLISIAALVVGVVVLDVGAQGLHITNQGEIYRLHPEARSRLTSAYMACCFAGGAIGSITSAAAYDRFGWNGVCVVGGCFSVAIVGVWIVKLSNCSLRISAVRSPRISSRQPQR